MVKIAMSFEHAIVLRFFFLKTTCRFVVRKLAHSPTIISCDGTLTHSTLPTINRFRRVRFPDRVGFAGCTGTIRLFGAE